jgi:hypothetical protein
MPSISPAAHLINKFAFGELILMGKSWSKER